MRTAPGAARPARAGGAVAMARRAGRILMRATGAAPQLPPAGRALLPLLPPALAKSPGPRPRPTHPIQGTSPLSGLGVPGLPLPREARLRKAARGRKGEGPAAAGLAGLGVGTKRAWQLGAQVLPWKWGRPS